MNPVGLLNTSIQTSNLGDYIIVESVKRELKDVLDGSFVMELPTHAPLTRLAQFGFRPARNSEYQSLRNLQRSFLCGTNLLTPNMMTRWQPWKVRLRDARYLRNVVCVGVGMSGSENPPNAYTRHLYGKLLDKNVAHSVRDARTGEFLASCGFQTINTGCATLWCLTESHCSQIPTGKSENAVVTITDYAADAAADSALLATVLREYKQVYCWLQGINDLDYLAKLGYFDKLELINPSLSAYNDFLETHDCDYVGTRLHAGIKAMQKMKRAIIVTVDNRARDMAETYRINTIERGEIGALEALIQSSFETSVGIDKGNIDLFLGQFL